jgi:hypothetical protein
MEDPLPPVFRNPVNQFRSSGFKEISGNRADLIAGSNRSYSHGSSRIGLSDPGQVLDTGVILLWYTFLLGSPAFLLCSCQSG